MAINEADGYTSVIVWTVRPEDRQQRCDVSVVVRRWCSTQEMRCGLVWSVWRNGCEGVVCILALWKLCGFCGIVCELLVDFR